MQKEKAAQQHILCASVFLARRCFFRSRRRAVRHSLGLSVRQRARAIPRLLLHARLRLLSRGARYLTVKIYGEGKPRRAHSRRPAVRGGREIAREIQPYKRADESRADRVSESTKFSNEDCDRHASSCTRRIDSIPRPLYIYTRARVIITPRRVIIIVEIKGTEEESAKRYYNIYLSPLSRPRETRLDCAARAISGRCVTANKIVVELTNK